MSNIDLRYGDCYELIKEIPDKSIDLVYIDIPYSFSKPPSKYNGDNEFEKRMIKKRDYLKFISKGIDYSIFDELCRVMKEIHIYIWCSRLQLLDIMDYFINKKGCTFDLLVWCKSNPAPTTNNCFLPDLEYCLFFRKTGKTKLNDGYELKSKWYVSPLNVSDKDLFLHPTIKPLELVKRHILHSTNEGDTVLDCFMGSGTTGVACKETNRNFIGMEIDEQYFKIAKDRLNGITANGQTSIFTDFSLFKDQAK